jgi:hypothetical protein
MYDVITGAPLGPRVTAVTPAEEYTLILEFSNGERRVFNAMPLLDIDAFKPLADKAFFQTVKTAYGSISWPCGIDYCPDTLYNESVPYLDMGGRM